MTIIVVEPHPDDAYLSVGWHLVEIWSTERRIILTVFSDRKRKREAEAYAEAIGAESVCLGLTGRRMSEEPSGVRLPEVPRMLSKLPRGVRVFPVGLQHPDHVRVAREAPRGCLTYLDTPYQMKLKNSEELSAAVEGREIVSICWPPKRKWKYSDIFKSQALFFHYNPLSDWKLPEMLLR